MMKKLVSFLIFSLCAFGEEGSLPTHNDGWERIHLTPDSWVGRIIINDKTHGITESSWIYVKAALDSFREGRPACVVLELNTPGGEVFAAQKISEALKSLDTKDHIPVIAFVNNWAISAGAMLAYSCRYIIASSDASMGAATPIIQTSEGSKEAPEKITSAFRTDFANRAAFFERNPDLAKAMVDPDELLVRREGRLMSMSGKEVLPTDEIISPAGKILTLTARQMVDYGVANAVIPRETFHTPDTDFPSEVALGQTALGTIPFFSSHQNISVKTFQMDFKTKIISFLALPFVTSTLVFVAMICFYLELTTPGVTLPGIVGAMALFLLAAGSFAQESITWFEPICFVTGLLLVILELMFFPTLGFLLLLGGGLFLFGLLSFVIPGFGEVRYDGETLNAAGEYVINRLAWISGAFLFATTCIVLFGRKVTSGLLHSAGLILGPSVTPSEKTKGITVGDDAVAVTTLRPSGKIEWKGDTFDAVSSGRLIEKGERVKISSVKMTYVTVEPQESR